MEEWMRPAALTIAFAVLLSVGDRKKYLCFDSILCLGFGSMYIIVPYSTVNSMVKGDLDNEVCILLRFYGIFLIGSAIAWYLTRETLDGTVPITLIMSRLFGCSVQLLMQAYSFWGTNVGKKDVDWNDQFVVYGMYGTLLWLLTNVWFLIKSDDFSTYPQHNIRINTHLRFDAWMSMLLAVAFMAFPDFIVKFLAVPRTCVSLHVCRCLGAVQISSVIVSLQAPGFLHEKDKRAQFAGRLVSHLFNFFAFVLMALWYNNIPLPNVAKVFLMTSPILINAAIGLFADGTIIYTPPKKKN